MQGDAVRVLAERLASACRDTFAEDVRRLVLLFVDGRIELKRSVALLASDAKTALEHGDLETARRRLSEILVLVDL